MALETILWLAVLPLSIVESSSYFDEYYHNYNYLQTKQGFAVHPVYDDAGDGFVQCGTRTIPFEPRRTPKVVGGSETPYGAYPWQVEIKIMDTITKKFRHLCGGAVVGPKTVVTAAHCFDVKPLKVENFRVVTGDHRLKVRDEHEHSFRVRKIVSHPQFRGTGPHSNDIAVVSIGVGPGGIPFSSHVRPICLPIGIPTTGYCAVTGWGSVQENDENLSPILRAAAVPLVDTKTCRMLEVYGGREQPILDTMICAGLLQGGIDACGGDSGGPLACERNGKFELTGLVSWGDGCGKKNRPGVYTKVYSYVDWIENTIIDMGDA